MRYKIAYGYGFFLALLIHFLSGCTGDNPEPTGLFGATFSGDFTYDMEGNARFRLEPSGNNGIVIVNLTESNNTFIRIVLPNPNASKILLEPGTYTIVTQLGNDVFTEALVDFVKDGLTFKAQSGQVNIGISKTTQISGQIANAEFSVLRSMCNGTFDSIPE